MGFTKVAPAGIGTEPGDGYRIGNSFLHSTGLNVSGIITATQGGTVKYFGDGSGLSGVSGLGTALSNVTTNPLSKFFYVNSILSIDSNTTFNPPPTAVAVYTNYSELRVEEGVDLIIESGDLVPDVLDLFAS